MWIQIGRRKLIPLVISTHRVVLFWAETSTRNQWHHQLQRLLWKITRNWTNTHFDTIGFCGRMHLGGLKVIIMFLCSFIYICHHQRMSWQSRLATAFSLINCPEKTSRVYSGSHVIKNWFACYPSFSIIKIIIINK